MERREAPPNQPKKQSKFQERILSKAQRAIFHEAMSRKIVVSCRGITSNSSRSQSLSPGVGGGEEEQARLKAKEDGRRSRGAVRALNFTAPARRGGAPAPPLVLLLTGRRRGCDEQQAAVTVSSISERTRARTAGACEAVAEPS